MRFLRSLDPEPFFIITISFSLTQLLLASIGIVNNYWATILCFGITSIIWYVIPSIGYRIASITWMRGVLVIVLVALIMVTLVHWWVSLPVLYFITPFVIGYIYPKSKN